MTFRPRVVVYVERGDELLVFDHRDHPEAGVQVRAGGVLDGEALNDAGGLPDAWEHVVHGDGDDAGLVFLCRFDAAPELWPVQAVYRDAR